MNYFFKHKEILGTLLGFALLLLPLISIAAVGGPTGSPGGPTGSPGGPTGYPTAGGGGGSFQGLKNPLNVDSVCELVIALVNAVMIIGIPIAILFIVWAGFKFVLAQGNPGALEEARSNFLHVIIGIGIFVGASLIASVIMNTLQNLGVQGVSSC